MTRPQILSALKSASRYILPALNAACAVWFYGTQRYDQGWEQGWYNAEHGHDLPGKGFPHSWLDFLMLGAFAALPFALAKFSYPRLAGLLAVLSIVFLQSIYWGKGV